MKNTTFPQDLGERIERLVRAYISDTQVAAQAALERAFASAVEVKPRRREASGPVGLAVATRKRRASTQVAELGERFYEAVCARPGAAMTVLAEVVGATARELHRSVTLLKQSGRIRSVGNRSGARYFPLLGAASAAE